MEAVLMEKQEAVGRVGRAWRRAGGGATGLIRTAVVVEAAARRAFARVLEPEPGQSMVEYAIVLALVALAAMLAVQLLGTGVAQVFTNILGKIQNLGT
jgi:Flp pilus assembly pilin Flp